MNLEVITVGDEAVWAGLQDFVSAFPQILEQVADKSADIIEARMRDNAPVKSGYLLSTIGSVISGTTAFVGAAAEYAPYVNAGTRPHIIEAKNVKALHFGNVFAKRVFHPGFEGRHFIEKTRDEVIEPIMELLLEQLQEALPGSVGL